MAQIPSKVFITRQFSERRVDNSHFNGQYLENCRVITGIISADLKLILLSRWLPKMKKIEPWEF
jgi:hypothetical protein